MSVIAWDGKTLAADKRATHAGLIRTTTKIFRANGCLVGYDGGAANGEEMVAWFIAGENIESFPAMQRDKDDYCGFLIIRPDGRIEKYERTPYPIKFHDPIFAIGSGRDFTLMAMHLGKSAAESVELTALFENGCGNGVDVLELKAK